MSDEIKNLDEIGIPAWYRPGNGHMLRREYLPDDHPESVYNYIKNTLKLKPEDYGVFYNEELRNQIKLMTQEEMVSEIIRLREEVTGYLKAGF